MFSKKSAETPAPSAPARPATPRATPVSKSSSSSGSFSVLGADVTITGNIAASTELHIDGTVEGDIDCASLVQGEASQIAGEVKAESARLAGRVDGSIHARELVILRSATINGDVHYEALTVSPRAKPVPPVRLRASRAPRARAAAKAPLRRAVRPPPIWAFRPSPRTTARTRRVPARAPTTTDRRSYEKRGPSRIA